MGDDPRTQGFDVNVGGTHKGHPPTYFSPYRNVNLTDGEKGEYLTDRLTQEAISFVEKNKDKPFFLYLQYFTVHTPLQGKKELVEKYRAKIKKNKRFNAKFGAIVESMDENIGKLLGALEANNLTDNTMVVFYSDNGGLAQVSSQSPLRAGKGSYYEGGIRVPCIIRWPNKIKESRSIEEPITGLDFYPTLMDVVGNTNNYELNGVSLLPMLTQNKKLEERSLFWHFLIYLEGVNPKKDEARDPLFRTRPGSVIRKGDWKLHHYFENDEYELYNLALDLGEKNDLSQTNPEKLKELLNELNEWRAQNNAPIPTTLNHEYIDISE